MKVFLLSIFIIILAISLAVYGFKYWQEASQQGQAPIVFQQTLVGILKPVTSIGEYSDVVVSSNKTTGVTSSTINLKRYENKKVKIIGNYSGNTMYADSVTIIQ